MAQTFEHESRVRELAEAPVGALHIRQGRGCWCQQCIPSEPLRRGFGRLKSAAGKAPISDANAPVVWEGSRVHKPQFRTCWEKIWRFYALSMDSADEHSGYLDKFRFHDLLQKRGQVSDRTVIKKLWTIATAGARRTGDNIDTGDVGGKLRYHQHEEDGREGFLEFVEAWGEECKRRAALESASRSSLRGSNSRGPEEHASTRTGGDNSEKLVTTRSVGSSKSWQSSSDSGKGPDDGNADNLNRVLLDGKRGVDWVDLARQRTATLSPADLAQAYSLPTLQPDQKQDLLQGLRNLRKVSAKSSSSKKQWEEIFSKFDINNSNRLELKEFTNMLRFNTGMQTRDSQWFKKFVPELYKFISQEHVRSLGGITAEELSRLLHVRTVEELDAFLQGRLVDAAVAVEAAKASTTDEDCVLLNSDGSDEEDSGDNVVTDVATVAQVVELKHKWLWRSGAIRTGRPHALDGEAEWTEFPPSHSRTLERGLAAYHQDRTKNVVTLHINTSRDAAREMYDGTRAVLHPYVIDFEKKQQQSQDTMTIRSIDWIPLADHYGTEGGTAAAIAAEGVHIHDSVASSVVPHVPLDGVPSSRRKLIDPKSQSKPKMSASAPDLIPLELEPGQRQLARDDSKYPQVEQQPNLEPELQSKLSEPEPEPQPQPHLPESEPEPEPEPERETRLDAGTDQSFPMLPGQTILTHVEMKQPGAQPKSKNLSKSVSFKDIDSPAPVLVPASLQDVGPTPAVLKDQQAATFQPKMPLRLGTLSRAVAELGYVLSWGAVWEQARKICPTLPRSSDETKWLPTNEVALSLVVGTAKKWNESSSTAFDSPMITSKVVSFNGSVTSGDETSNGVAESMVKVFGTDELAGLRAILHIIGENQNYRKCGELKAQLFLQGWENAVDVMEVFARADVAFTYVDVNVNGTSPSRANFETEGRWEQIFKNAASNWTRHNENKEPLSNIKISARRCSWLNAAVLQAITTFGQTLQELDLSDNLGGLNSVEGADFVAESQHQLTAGWRTSSVPTVSNVVEERVAAIGDNGAEITPSMLQYFSNGCDDNQVKGLKLTMKRCDLVSLHLQRLADISLSSLDVSQQQPRLQQQHDTFHDLSAPECFSPAALEWFFKSQRHLWQETSRFPAAPVKEPRPRCATLKGVEYCWGLRTFKAQSCGLTDAHIDRIRKASLPSLTKVNLSGNRLITVQAQGELRYQQAQLVGEQDQGFTLICHFLAWVDLLLALGFQTSEGGRSRQEVLEWGEENGLDVLADKVRGISLEEPRDERLDQSFEHQSRSGLSRQQSYGSSSSSTIASSEPNQNEFVCSLNGVEVCGFEGGEEDDDIDIDLTPQAKERRRLARLHLGLFIWRLINREDKLADLLLHIKDKQENGQTKAVDLQLLGSRWHHPHIEQLRKSGCHIKRLKIGWNQQQLRRHDSAKLSEPGPLTYIKTLDITHCSDQFLEAFSEFVIFELVVNDSNLTSKALTLFRDRQVAIDVRHRGLYRTSGKVIVTAVNNVRHGHGSSWDAESLAVIASLPGLRKLTIDLNVRANKLRRSKRNLSDSFDERALVTLVQTISSQQSRGIASKDFCLSMRSCGRLSLDFIKGLAKCCLREVDASECKHVYGPDGSLCVANALESPEWASLDRLVPYVDTFTEPRGLFALSLAALRHPKMSRFCLKVGFQEQMVQQALRTNRPYDLPLTGLFGKLMKIFSKVAGPGGGKSRRSLRRTTTEEAIVQLNDKSSSRLSLDIIDESLKMELFDFSDKHALHVWQHPVHFALGMASRCKFLADRLASYAEDCAEFALLFEQAATELLDECNDRFEAEKILLDNGHRFIRGEHPLNYALRNQFVHFVSCRWATRYTDDVWNSVDPWRSSTTEIGFGPVADFTQALFAQTALVRLLSIPTFLVVTIVSLVLLPVLYLIQMIVGDRSFSTRKKQVDSGAARLAKKKNSNGALSTSSASSQSSSYSEDDDRIYPGRWPRRLLMLLRLVWSTAVVKYYTAVWGYSLFLIVLMLVGFRTPESRSGWNYVRDFPAELIIWAYGVSWLVQEYYELCNRYRSMTFLPDSAINARHEPRDGRGSDRGGSMLLGLEKTRLWPWQTNNFARIKGVIFAHYNDPWNLLDLTIVVFIFWHCMLSTAWNKNWDPSDGINAWLDLRPTRTEASTRPVLGMTAILGWFRCLGLMKVHPKLGPMVTITLIMFGNILQFIAMIWFIMMGFGTAFILLHFDDRDNFSTGIATIHRVFWSGTLGESFDTTGDAETSMICAESGPFLTGLTDANFECRDIYFKDLLMKVYMFLMSVVFMNLLIAMLSKTYEDVEAKAFLQWRLLLAQTTMEFYENVQHVSELAPFNLVTVPFSICVRLLQLCWRVLEWTQDRDRSACARVCGGVFHKFFKYWFDEESNDDESDDSGQADTLWAHFRPPWRKIPGEVDVSFMYGGQTLGGVETLSRRSLYLEEAVGYFPEELRSLSELHPLEQTSKPGEAAMFDASAHMSYRDSDSHPHAFGVLKAWLSTKRGAKLAALERDLLDVTLKKATPLQLRTGGVAGNAMYDDDMLDSATDPQGDLRRFIPIKFDDRALHVIASKELYDVLEVKPEARVFFSSADLHSRWLDTMENDRAKSVDGGLQSVLDQIMLQREA